MRDVNRRGRQVLVGAVSAVALAAVPQAQAATFTFSGTAAGTYNWSAGTSWSATPLSAADTTLAYSGALAVSAAVISNNDNGGNFLLNRLSITNTGTTTAGTLTIQGNPLEFVTTGGTAPTLFLDTGTNGPVVTINNGLVLTDGLSAQVMDAFTIGGVISGAGSFTKTNASTAGLTLTNTNTYLGATNLGTLGSGTTASLVTLNGANGAIASSSAIGVHGAGTRLFLDNAAANNANRLNNSAGVTLGTGGELSLAGNGATASTTEAISTLTFGAGNNIVTLSNTGATQLVTLNGSGFSRTGNATGLIRGSSLGQQATNAGRVTLTSQAGLTLVGTSTANGATPGSLKDLKIVPYLFGDTSATGTGGTSGGFLTYDTTGGLRPLGANEYTTLTAGFDSTTSVGHNVKSFSGTLTNANPTVNSLLVGSTHVLNGSGTLTINSGAIATNNATGNTAAAISGFTGVTLGNGEGVALVNGYLNVNVPISVTSSGGLTKGGTGTLVLNATNLYGTTLVNSGTLQLGNGTSNGTLGSGSAAVNPQGTIALNLTDGSAVSNPIDISLGGNVTRAAATTNVNSLTGGISGTGGITLNVVGSTLGLSGTQSTNTGATTVVNGNLRVVGNVLSASSPLNLNPSDNTGNARLQLRADADTTFQNGGFTFNTPTGASGRTINIDVDQATAGNSNKILTLAGDFTVKGYQTTHSVNFTGANGYGLAIGQLIGSSWDSAGGGIALNVTAPGGLTIAGYNQINGQTTLDFTGTGNTTITGAITRGNSTTISQSGPGQLTLAGSASSIAATNANGYIFNLSNGKLNVNNAAALGDGNAVTDAAYIRTVNISGGTLDNTSGAPIVVANNRAATTNSNSFVTNINGNFAFGGTNDLQLNVGTGTGSGTGVAQRGYITLGTTGGTRTITANGTAPLNLNGAIVNGGGASPTASGITKDGPGTLVLSRPNFYSGVTTINAGTLVVNGTAVQAQTNVTGTRATSGSGATQINGLSTGVVTNLQVGQTISGTGIPLGTIVTGKLSATSIAISQVPTAAGAVSDLAFSSGSGTGTGAVIVDGVSAGVFGTLAGSGTIAGSVTVQGFGHVAPGNSPGVLTLANGVTFGANSSYDVEINGIAGAGVTGGHDQLAITGGSTSLAGNLNVSFASFVASGSEVFYILNNTAGALSGTFQYADNTVVAVANGYSWAITYDGNIGGVDPLNGGNDVALYATAVPEPTTLGMLALAGLGLLRRRRN